LLDLRLLYAVINYSSDRTFVKGLFLKYFKIRNSLDPFRCDLILLSHADHLAYAKHF
jgi:hypothetical protein